MVNKRRPMTQNEMAKARGESERRMIKLHNRSKQMIPIHMRVGPSDDFFLSEQSIKLAPGKYSLPVPQDRVNMNQVENLQKKGMIRVIKL